MPTKRDTTKGGEDPGDGRPTRSDPSLPAAGRGYPEGPLDIAIARGAREIAAAGGPSKAA
ncbi:MAG: hypothetical protein JRJ75_13775 [Deltaproteobacteria bacterium]|nr:hypothetical protein [Deltaproteobacteria bacterium]